MLTARESDPEDVLKGLGFRGPTVLDKIPDRFIKTGTICEGVNSEQFLYSVQDDLDDSIYTVSPLLPLKLEYIPPTSGITYGWDLLSSLQVQQDVGRKPGI